MLIKCNRPRTNVKRMPANWATRIPVLILVILAFVWRVGSQTTAPATGAANPLPQRVLYGQLFRHVVFLDYQAAAAEQAGQDGSALLNYYQVHAALTPTETALLKSTAHSAITSLTAVNQQIQSAALSFRTQLQNNQWPAGQPRPAPPPELKVLQSTKDNIILNGLASLQSGFGASRFQHLDNYVQTVIAPHITVTNLPQVPTPPKTTTPLLPMPWIN